MEQGIALTEQLVRYLPVRYVSEVAMYLWQVCQSGLQHQARPLPTSGSRF